MKLQIFLPEFHCRGDVSDKLHTATDARVGEDEARRSNHFLSRNSMYLSKRKGEGNNNQTRRKDRAVIIWLIAPWGRNSWFLTRCYTLRNDKSLESYGSWTMYNWRLVLSARSSMSSVTAMDIYACVKWSNLIIEMVMSSMEPLWTESWASSFAAKIGFSSCESVNEDRMASTASWFVTW